MAIDLRPGKHTFRVSTAVQGPDGKHDSRMGPDVIVQARDAEHAKEVAKAHGHTPNSYFPPKQIEEW